MKELILIPTVNGGISYCIAWPNGFILSADTLKGVFDLDREFTAPKYIPDEEMEPTLAIINLWPDQGAA